MHSPFQLTADMIAFASSVSQTGSVRDRSRALYQALLDGPDAIRYSEDMSGTWRPQGCKTAAAVFSERGPDGDRFAMCIEYTHLFIALGRHLGLTVSAFRQDAGLGESGGYVFGHIVAGVQDGDEWSVIDLCNRRFYRAASGFSRISDTTLAAYHHNNSGLIFRSQGQLERADAEISAALELDPGHSSFWYNRGCVRLVSGRAAAAEADLRQAARLCPESVPVLTNLAVAQNGQGQRQAAEQTLMQALRLAPEDNRITYNLGILSWQDGRFDTAAAYWLDVLAREPLHRGATQALSQLPSARPGAIAA